MRLQAIKLAGFKSFVDPTTVPFPSNLCAVVGPNGCGKSNIIDAIRWVMGESSAKNLRGESMADVIFNGSTSRKPVGQASIELLFDNSDGRLAGEYANYNEISVKRQVIRDGTSNYFLNSQKCRRKDITDIFLGTGLGPRSYSIIEQGMISQLIEARPEDLRVYIEEAAGISKYKERRRETERRINHTRDNLDRLADLRDELERQLHHLERQAKAAQRYTELRKEERGVRAQLLALRWQALNREVSEKDANITRLEIEREARVADQLRINAQVEEKRAAVTDLSDALNEVQRRFYDCGTTIARLEETIAFQQEKEQQLSLDLEQVQGNWHKIDEDLQNDRQQLVLLEAELAEVLPQQSSSSQSATESASQLIEIENVVSQWQAEWDEFIHEASATRQKVEVEQTRIGQFEHALDRLKGRIELLQEEQETLASSTVEAEIEPLTMMLETQQEQAERMELEIQSISEKLNNQRAENQQQTGELDELRNRLQGSRGRLASLDALQQAALGQQDDAEVDWLEGQGLSQHSRLGEVIKVQEPWAVAVETVLGDHLQAVCLDSLDAVTGVLGEFEKGSLTFIEKLSAPVQSGPAETLLSMVDAPLQLSAWLGSIFVSQDLTDALARRPHLNSDESVITPEGIWLGSGWLRVKREVGSSDGVIKRQQAIEGLIAEIEELSAREEETANQLDSGIANLQVLEKDRDDLRDRLAEQQRAYNETRAQLSAREVQAEQIKTDLARVRQELQDGQSQREDDESRLREARGALEIAIDQMQMDNERRELMQTQREETRAALEQARAQAQQDRNSSHALELRIQSLQSQQQGMRQALTRLESQQLDLRERRETLEQARKDGEEPQQELKGELETLLGKRLAIESELSERRQGMEKVEHQIRQHEEQRVQIDESIDEIRASLERVRMDWQALEVRRKTIEEQLQEDEQNLDEVIRALPAEANEHEWDDQLTRLGNRIQRLGAINLAAIDEFKVQQERKQYLDAQNEDLEKALATLENAIRKIDIETRTRFKETFDQVNSKLQQFFPKLFGGGHAYLEMTGEDLLDTGVGLMARPPGKRNASIHLLSGGEKALTAIALVFSIFTLNPAPFCLLDEVDAPLDDHNVNRYSEMVKEMSRTVQFIYITHNKISMEMADQLMGVTMQEPGVSRLVSVDVEEAVALAAV